MSSDTTRKELFYFTKPILAAPHICLVTLANISRGTKDKPKSHLEAAFICDPCIPCGLVVFVYVHACSPA